MKVKGHMLKNVVHVLAAQLKYYWHTVPLSLLLRKIVQMLLDTHLPPALAHYKWGFFFFLFCFFSLLLVIVYDSAEIPSSIS